jgi:uncharacterized FlgJ-related protein
VSFKRSLNICCRCRVGTGDQAELRHADLSAGAVQDERAYGVPAATLVAMAIVESGYGWTRTTRNANNFFGWKYTDTRRPKAVRPTLTSENFNNEYIVFESRAEAIDYLASKLATLAYYRANAEGRHTLLPLDDCLYALQATVHT